MTTLANYTAFSVVAAALCLGSAFQNAHSFPEMVSYVFSSKLRVLIFVNFAYNLLFLLGRTTQHFFLGALRTVETQSIYERLVHYVLFKIVFVGAVLDAELKELLVWCAWFSILGFLKLFALLGRDRFDYLISSSPSPTSKPIIKVLSLLMIILLSDILWFQLCVSIFYSAGLSVLLLLTFECFVVFLECLQPLLKYAIHVVDLRHEGFWEQRGTLMYYNEFLTETAILIATLAHYVHILWLNGISLTLIDAVLLLHMRMAYTNLRDKIVAFMNYRTVAAYLNSRYPTVTGEELAKYNDDCPICREPMQLGKKLPCGHIFHTACLRTWLEQHHSCPTCRRSLIENPQPQADNRNGVVGGAGIQGEPLHRMGGGFEVNPNEHSLFRFNSDHWLSFLPSFSVEVVRRSESHPGNMVDAVAAIFPNVPRNVIAEDLARTGSVELTTENILDGRIPTL